MLDGRSNLEQRKGGGRLLHPGVGVVLHNSFPIRRTDPHRKFCKMLWNLPASCNAAMHAARPFQNGGLQQLPLLPPPVGCLGCVVVLPRLCSVAAVLPPLQASFTWHEESQSERAAADPVRDAECDHAVCAPPWQCPTRPKTPPPPRLAGWRWPARKPPKTRVS